MPLEGLKEGGASYVYWYATRLILSEYTVPAIKKNQTKIIAFCFLPLFVNQKNTKLHFTTTVPSHPYLFFLETIKNILDAWKLSNVTF